MKSTPPLLARIHVYSQEYTWLLYCAMLLSGISALLSLIPFLGLWGILREVFLAFPSIPENGNSIQYSIWACIGAIVGMLLYTLALVLSHIVAFRVEKNIRKKSIEHIMRLPLGYFAKHPSGEIRKNIEENASATHAFIAHQLPDIVGMLFLFIGLCGMLFFFDWRLGCVSLVIIIGNVWFLGKMMHQGNSKGFYAKYMTALAHMNASCVEYIRGMPVIKIFSQTVYSFQNFYKNIADYRDFVLKYTISWRYPMTFFTTSLGILSILMIPIALILIALTEDTSLTFFINVFFSLLLLPFVSVMMARLMDVGAGVIMVKSALGEVDTILNEKPLPQSLQPQSPKKYDIVCEHVYFQYDQRDTQTLSDIHFRIPEGTITALVGESGGGKSTIAKLIARFYDVERGSVQVGGIDVRNIDTGTLMRAIAFIFQTNTLFPKTLRENLVMEKEHVSDAQILKALKAAQCDDILEKLPKGLDTLLEQDNTYLSGGEKQRIIFARAIIKDAPIIILDEATSFADPENEYKIQKAFGAITKGKTVLMIAHKLESIKNADQILVIQKGEIIESGTHETLLSNNSYYANTWKESERALLWKI